MFRSLISASLLAIALQVGAQSLVHQVFVLNEGYYDFFGPDGQVVPVTLGSFDPATGSYQTVATLAGPRFGSDVLVHEGVVFVAADDRVYRFDADTYAELGSAPVQGVRKLAVWNDLLLLTRGELGGVPLHLEARTLQTLEFVAGLGPDEGLEHSAEDILVVGDKAYLAVNNAFAWDDLQGRIAVLDLPSLTLLDQVDLGPQGLNPEHLMLHDGDVLAFNNTDFTGSSISRISTAGNALVYTTMVSVNSGCAASARVGANSKVYFLEYAQNELARFDLGTGTVSDTLAGSPSVYGLIEDPINGVLYGTTTDFFSSGELHVMDLEGQVITTVPVGVAPGNLALDVRSATGVAGRGESPVTIGPNPVADVLYVVGVPTNGPMPFDVLDATGRVVMNGVLMDAGGQLQVSALKPGTYFLRLNGPKPSRFVKQ